MQRRMPDGFCGCNGGQNWVWIESDNSAKNGLMDADADSTNKT